MEKTPLKRRLSVLKRQSSYLRTISIGSTAVAAQDTISDDDVFYPADKFGSWSNLSRISRFSRQTSRQTGSRRPSCLPSLAFQTITTPITNQDNSSSYQLSYMTCETIIPAKIVPRENTFKLEPDKNFPTDKVTQLINQVLLDQLADKMYSASMGNTMSKALAQEIKEKVQLLNLPRYKIVSYVSIGQKPTFGITIASEILADSKRDKTATVTMETDQLFAIGTVYAFYYE